MVTASAHRFVHDCPPALCIVPISISYDFMTTRRAGIFVNIAPVIEHAPLLAQQALDEQLRNAWRQHMHFTCTQLASGFLVQASRTGMLEFTLDDITRSVEQQARMLAQAGRLVDNQFAAFPYCSQAGNWLYTVREAARFDTEQRAHLMDTNNWQSYRRGAPRRIWVHAKPIGLCLE